MFSHQPSKTQKTSKCKIQKSSKIQKNPCLKCVRTTCPINNYRPNIPQKANVPDDAFTEDVKNELFSHQLSEFDEGFDLMALNIQASSEPNLIIQPFVEISLHLCVSEGSRSRHSRVHSLPRFVSRVGIQAARRGQDCKVHQWRNWQYFVRRAS